MASKSLLQARRCALTLVIIADFIFLLICFDFISFFTFILKRDLF